MSKRQWIGHVLKADILLTALLISTALFPKDEVLQLEMLPSLPAPVSNNAVALIADGLGVHLYSALGLGAGKTWRDTRSDAFHYSPKAGAWRELGPVPGSAGRLAASAAVAGGEIYVFGGYTVAEDGSEESTPAVYRLDRQSGHWKWFSDMPVPVEDAVVLTYRDRYIYLVSGWHDLGNVNLVQVLDSRTGLWQQATPWPGTPVFGHAGGIVGSRLIICDGVRIEYAASSSAGEAPRKFLPSAECWHGDISADNFRRIDWRRIESHPGRARYRMAAGSDNRERVFFVGGSVNPYNFNGVGYDGNPSQPEAGLMSYSFEDESWACHGNLPEGTMDHRGLPWHEGWFYLIGGMRGGQQVSDDVLKFKPAQADTCHASTRQISARLP